MVQHVHWFVSILLNLSRQISNEKTCQNISTICSCSVFSLKPKFTVLFQKHTLLLKAYKHCTTDGSIIYAYIIILANRIYTSSHSREINLETRACNPLWRPAEALGNTSKSRALIGCFSSANYYSNCEFI
jgi:hypothetical protein